jgi:lysylphosphatidylglycerol synthetase-like protein (DUF2156 family)
VRMRGNRTLSTPLQCTVGSKSPMWSTRKRPMTKSNDTQHQVSVPKTALLGLLGTVVTSFLPAFLVGVISAVVSGGDGKFDVGGLIAIYAIILGIFSVIMVATYLVGLLSLFFVARVKRPSHAFWLAALASLLTMPAIWTGHPIAVVGVHLIVFPILCLLYRQSVNPDRNATAQLSNDRVLQGMD